MLERFREHLIASQLIPHKATVLVGYSGGADSTCLLHLLHESGVDVVAGHLHHGQREEADKEQALCQALCESLDIPFVTGRADVPGLARDMKVGLEEAGRLARYEFFQNAAMQTGCSLVATAHTRDDQVETVIFNLTRGTGLNGLAGIPEQRENIVRPLLPFSRTETQSYCKEHGFWTHDDPANTDLAFARARIRSNVLPELRLINPGLDKCVGRLAQIAREETEFLDGMAAAALERCEVRLNGDLSFLTQDCEIAFSRDLLSHVPDVLFKRAMRLAVAALGGNLDSLETEAALNGIRQKETGSVTAEGGTVVIEWKQDRILMRRLEEVIPFRFGLTVPGETISEEYSWAIQASQSSMPIQTQERASLEAYVNVEQAKGVLFFRSLKSGDEMHPLGFSGRRKVSDLMSEKGLTPSARGRLPVVCDMLGPVWVPGVCLEERVKALPESKTTLHLRFVPASEAGLNRNGADVLSVR